MIVEAAKASHIGRQCHYDWIKQENYKTAFADAQEEAIGVLEAEAHHRAMEGVEEPVIWQGKICFEPQRDPKTGQIKRDRKGQPLLSTTPLTIPRKSDNLLMFLLKKLDPSYRENAPVQRAAAASASPQIKVIFPDRDKP
jgi:hypothetical protein